MKNLVICFFLLFSASYLKAQAPPVPPLTKPWQLIAEKYYKDNSKGKQMPVFPAALQAQVGKPIELPGYMIPIKAAMTHTDFFISVLPVYQCDFCGQFGIPAMVAVHVNKAIPFTDETIKIRGKLVLNSSEDYSVPDVSVTDAEVVN